MGQQDSQAGLQCGELAEAKMVSPWKPIRRLKQRIQVSEVSCVPRQAEAIFLLGELSLEKGEKEDCE